MHIKRLLLLTTLVSALFAVAAPVASAQECWKELVNDYWADNRVDRVYPIACYREAMEKLPRDVQEYSDAQDDIRRALLAAIRDERDGGGFSGPDASGGRSGGAPVTAPPDDRGSQGFFGEVIDKLGPKNADSVPVPLLVLAAIALLLIGAAGVSYAARWYQARRLGVPPPDPR